MKNAFLLFYLLFASISNAQNKSEYTITINKNDPYLISVSAKFNTKVDTLSIHPNCPNYDYTEGWSTFIKPTSKNLKFIGDSKWVIENKEQVSYDVDLSFVKKQWDVGNEQAGIFMDSSMFIVTRSLFLFDKNNTSTIVTFNLPNGYSVGSPWISTGKNQYQAKSTEALTNNTLVWGELAMETITSGGFNLQFALLDYSNDEKELVRDIFKKTLDNYIRIFPQTPESNYLITVFPQEQNDGEAYASSNAFTLKSPITEKNKTIWANQFAHELFHYWNGRMINGPNRNERQWFSEGFTEYFANLTLVRSQVISEEEFYNLIEKTIGVYYFYKDRQYPEVSLQSAGAKKNKYRFGVYNGGWCAAFVMDMIITEKFPNKSLEDFMNVLFIKYGLTGTGYMLHDLEKEFKNLIGDESDNFFNDYIRGTKALPLTQYFRKIGITLDYTSYEATAFLFKDISPSEEQKLLQDRWLMK